MKQQLKTLMSTSLSPEELRRLYLPKHIKVVMYDDVIKHPLEDLFKFDNCFVLFYPNEKNADGLINGHYVSVVRNGNTIYFYDSYGDKPDTSQKTSLQRAELYKERHNSLIRRFIETGYNIDYNNHKHQSDKGGISTCGRHSLMRCLNSDLSNDEYHQLIKQLSKKHHLTPDALVTVIFS